MKAMTVGKTTERAKKAEKKLKRMDMGEGKPVDKSMRKEGACPARLTNLTEIVKLRNSFTRPKISLQ